MTDPARAVGAPRMIDVFLVAGEESGDRLGTALMRALRQRTGGRVSFAGVGGHGMASEGLASLFPIEELSIIGFSAIPKRLPAILRRIRATVEAVVQRNPDVLVIIDSPEFTHRVAKRVRAAAPAIPIVDYVSPSVWAWRPGRARKMRHYVDHVLGLLPFEPDVHRRLGGPPCTLCRASVDRRSQRPASQPGGGTPPARRAARAVGPAGEQERRDRSPDRHVRRDGCPRGGSDRDDRDRGADDAASWPSGCGRQRRHGRTAPRIVVESAEKRAAFRVARAALAKSGTVTLELALAGVPMVTAYKVSAIETLIGRPIKNRLPSVILANLVLGENVVPEFLQEDCTADNLANALVPLFADTPERRRQIEAFRRLDAIMEIGTSAPATRAADIVLEYATQRADTRAVG